MRKTLPARILPYFLLTLSLGQISQTAAAQECRERLQMAEELFSQGLVERLPDMLFMCIEQGFNNEQKIRAYKLIILSYYFDDAVDEATQAMENFIRLFPEFKPDPDDNPRFIHLFDSFEKKIIFAIGIQAGTSFVFPTFLRTSHAYSPGMVIADNYPYVPVSWRAGISHGYSINRQLNLGVDLDFASVTFRNNLVIDPGTGSLDLSYTENIRTFNLPIYLSVQLSQQRMQPYLLFGSQLSYLLAAKADITHLSPGGTEISQNGMDVSDKRFTVSTSALLGGGLRYYLSKGYFFMELRYVQGLSYHQKSGQFNASELNDPAINDLLWTYLYAGDNYRLSQVTFCLGYRISFHKIGLK